MKSIEPSSNYTQFSIHPLIRKRVALSSFLREAIKDMPQNIVQQAQAELEEVEYQIRVNQIKLIL